MFVNICTASKITYISIAKMLKAKVTKYHLSLCRQYISTLISRDFFKDSRVQKDPKIERLKIYSTFEEVQSILSLYQLKVSYRYESQMFFKKKRIGKDLQNNETRGRDEEKFNASRHSFSHLFTG